MAAYDAQPFEASKVILRGCSRQQLAGRACLEIELDKFALLEDDRGLNRPSQRDAFLCAKHGEAYAMLINNKRCSRPGCWRRGGLWKQDGGWLLEFTHHAQGHFKGPL